MGQTHAGVSRILEKFLPACAALLLLAAGPVMRAADVRELGHPLVRNFTPRDYQGHPLCQAVIQGADGVMYFANNTDALSFDGADWRTIKLPPESSGIRRFALTADGTIYLAGGAVLGCFNTVRGRAEYFSLIDQLPAAERRFSEIFQVLALGDAVYFANEEKIFIWRDHRFTIVSYPAPANARGVRLHAVGGALYLTAVGHPLSRLVDGRFELVADDPVFRENQILNVEPDAAGALRVLTEERGFFQLAAGRVSPVPTLFDRWLAGKQLNRALRLADGSLAVAFTPASGNGGMLFDAAGQLRWRLDESIGLLNPAIRDFFPDREGGLWLGLETGVTRIEWASGVTLFDPVNGLSPAFVVDTVIHDGVRYAATLDGVYRLHPADAAGHPARFERIFNQPVYSLREHPGGLLARGYTEIFVLTPSGFVAVAKSPIGMGALGGWKHDSRRVWFTSSRGLHSLWHTAEGWRDEGAVPGFEEHANGQTEEPDGTLLVSTHSSGVFRFEFGGEPGGPRIVNRILRFDADQQRYVPLDPAHPLPSAQQVDSRIPNQDVPGNTWLTNNSPESAKRTITRPRPNGQEQRLPQFVAEATGMIHRMREESAPDGDVLWICGANGLVRVDLARVFHAPTPFATLLRAGDLQAGEERSHARNALGFEFSAPRLQSSGVLYQTRLTGYEADWSPWSADRKRAFTNLAGGDYRFEVRARDADGVSGAPAVLAFSVLPPWWRTWWFIAFAGVGGIGAIAAVTRWFATRALKRRLALLEAQSAVERERLRLARDLHDEVGSGLGRVILFAGEAGRVKGDPAQLDAALGRVRTTAQDLVQHAREIVWAVSPQHDTLASLVERLGDYTVDTLRAAGIACRLDVPLAAEIPAVAVRSEVRHSLFLALKEAVHNCVKYSGATTADFTLRLAAGMLEITLRDHGRGFAAGERRGSGHGLRNLAIRAEALGGKGNISSEPGKGTTVVLRVPVSSPTLSAT